MSESQDEDQQTQAFVQSSAAMDDTVEELEDNDQTQAIDQVDDMDMSDSQTQKNIPDDEMATQPNFALGSSSQQDEDDDIDATQPMSRHQDSQDARKLSNRDA